MIGKIKGSIDAIYQDYTIIDVLGVGYIIYCSAKTLMKLSLGDQVSFFTQMIVKEDDISIYGFEIETDKHYFTLLQTVQGVGAKVALAILSQFTTNDIHIAVLSQDTKAFRQVNGIGPKLAERIVNELKSSKHFASSHDFSISIEHSSASNAYANITSSDAISALVALGYSRKDAFVAVNEIAATNENATAEEMIKISLKKFSGN